MYPPNNYSRRTTPNVPTQPTQRRTIPIDVDGEIFNMEWDRPGQPTKRDFADWIQKKRTPLPTTQTHPTTPLPTQQSKLATAPAARPDTGFLGGLKETAQGLGQFGANVLKSGPWNPDFKSRAQASADILGGFVAPVTEGYKDIKQKVGQGDYWGALSRASNVPAEVAGFPATSFIEDVDKGRYGHALGTGAPAAAMMAIGGRGPKGKVAGALPEVPPPVAAPIAKPSVQAAIPKRPVQTGWAPELETTRPTTQVVPEAGPVARAATSGIPELADAAKKTTLWERTKQKVQSAPGARAAADIGKSETSVIRDSGKTGPALAQKLSRTRLLGEYLGGSWIDKAKQATKDLTPEQVKVYIEARDTGAIPNDPAVVRALETRAALENEVVTSTKQSGAGLRTADGKIIPFRERTNYWPHIYERGKLKDPALIDKLVAEGWSPEDAQQAVANSSRFGERLISAQHERQGNAPGYRLDLDADYLHLNDLGKRVAEARELGPLDIADPNSPVSQLIKGTAEPNRITEIVTKHLGRDIPGTGAKDWGAVNQFARKAMTAAHLSHFALSNMSQLATVPLRANLGSYAGAIKKVATNWRKTVGEAEATGALQSIHQDLLREVGGEGFFSKVYGLKQSETLNRTVAAVSGKGTAEALFKQLKKDPTNKRARARLGNLLLEPVDSVLKQTSLTPEQQGIAGGRMAEITQGKAQSIDLPREWSGHPAAELALIFKKYAFQQGKIIKEVIKENPQRNIPLAIALYTAMGEGIGDVKAGIKGTVSGQGAGPAIAARGEGLDRIINNMAQAWAFGMLGDLLESAGKPAGLAEYAAGPVVSDINKTARSAYQAAQGNVKPAVKQAKGLTPFVGTGWAAGGGKGGGSGRLPRLSSLPSLPRP